MFENRKKRDKEIRIKCTKEEKDFLKKKAKERDTDVSNLVRRSIDAQFFDSNALTSNIFMDFLNGCPKNKSLMNAIYEREEIDPDIAAKMNVRSCKWKYYQPLSKRLLRKFGEYALFQAGLLAEGKKGLYPKFYPITGSGKDLLLFPYYRHGRPVYLKARAIDSRKMTDQFMWAGRLESPYNVDILDSLEDTSKIALICNNEIDTLSAMSKGHCAIGYPGFMSRVSWNEWAKLFRGKNDIILALSSREASIEIVQALVEEARFKPADLWEIKLDEGEKLKDRLHEIPELNEGESLKDKLQGEIESNV